MDWASLRPAKEAELRRLETLPLREVSPSIRDFTLHLADGRLTLAAIPALKRRAPGTGREWRDLDLVTLARTCDDAEVAAIGVYTEPSVFAASLDDVHEIAEAVTAPLLCLDLIFHPRQIQQARLSGADAVLVSAASVDERTLSRLISEATSIHVAAVVVVRDEDELVRAVSAGAILIGLAPPGGPHHTIPTLELASRVPSRTTVIALNELTSYDDAAALRGKVDAGLVTELILNTSDVPGTLRRLSAAA